MARHPRWVRKFMTEQDLDAVAQAIAAAERRTSAELRVHLDHACAGDPVARAVQVFERIGMQRTQARNGVLLYAAIRDHKLAAIGDAAVHGRLGDTYWQALVDDMARDFAAGPREAFIRAIEQLGEVLAGHFPRTPDDRDELSDQVSVE